MDLLPSPKKRHNGSYHGLTTTISDDHSPPSPTPLIASHNTFLKPFDFSFGDLSSTNEDGVIDHDQPKGVGGILQSLSGGRSYEQVEEDDYEMLEPPTCFNEHSPPVTSETQPLAEQRPVRTASVSRHLPLNHPIPDLQSLQGAYVKNVERLEETAERLSMTSSLDDELQKMRKEQRELERRTSATSSHHSVRHQRHISTGSIRSPARSAHPRTVRHSSQNSGLSQQLSEPQSEGRPLDIAEDPELTPPRLPVHRNEVTYPTERSNHPSEQEEHVPEQELVNERPTTSASVDTFDSAKNPFLDFDGVHYNYRTSLERGPSESRRISFGRPPLARDSRAFKEAQPGEKMIYYPAPVPVMLNLPTRLSRATFSEQEKRRLKALSGMPDEMRKAAPWLSNENENITYDKRASAAMPPQLRASAFFDHKSVTPNLVLKDGSAVATLDSILDASAYAPVSAFTDHPIVGQLGKEVYGAEKPHRKSMQSELDISKKRKSTLTLASILKPKTSSNDLASKRNSRFFRSSTVLDGGEAISGDELKPDEDEFVDAKDELSDGEGDEQDDDEQDSEDEHRPGFSGAPTTLLAELQLRKAAQKQRNRTAADAFPNGMHSTLLELDAVTQLQQRSRKQKHVTLAWEDHEAADKENYDDEDVPLGVLFSEKDRAKHMNINRPMGLLERREMEDNEPLSSRRARLRGEPLQPPIPESMVKPIPAEEVEDSKFKIDLPNESESLDEQEGETLAQRVKRIKEEKQRALGGDFAADVSSQLGLKTADEKIAVSKTPDPDETLGQRRMRLKEEAIRAGRQVSGSTDAEQAVMPALKPRRSMADILQAHPVGARQTTNEARLYSDQLQRFNVQNKSYASMPAPMANLPYYNNNPYMNQGFAASQGMMPGYPGYPQMNMNGYHFGYGAGMMPDPMAGVVLDPNQRAVIDRWRQGIA